MDHELLYLALVVLLQVPFAFAAGTVVRDGRGLLWGSLFAVIGGLTGAFVQPLAGTALVALPVILAIHFCFAHARFQAAKPKAPPSAPASSPVQPVAAPPQPTVPPFPVAAEPDPQPSGRAQGSSLLHLLALINETLEAADRIGELRHRRRLRKLKRQQAEHQASAAAPRYLRVVARREPLFKLPPPK